MTGGSNIDRGEFIASLPRTLRRLELCGDHTDAVCSAMREHLPRLRHLCLAACYRITDAGIRDLVAIPSLRELDLRQMRGLTAAVVEVLATAKQLEWLDLRHCDVITTEHVARLRRELPTLRLEANPEDSPR